MSRIQHTFEQLQAKGRKALIPYVTAGFPFADITPALMHDMVEAGADIIELGVPFSDPMADGPVIQKAGEKALALGVGMVQVLEMVRQFRQRNATTPVVLMGYANPVERYDQTHGSGAFVRDAAAAGVDGVLMVNEGMQAQATGAEQINLALVQLGDASSQTVESLRQASFAIDELSQVAVGLRSGVSRFKV